MIDYETAMAEYFTEMREAGAKMSPRWGVTDYSELDMGNGLAYTFRITDNGTVVAHVVNEGRGGADLIQWEGGIRNPTAQEFESEAHVLFGDGWVQDSMVSALLLRSGH